MPSYDKLDSEIIIPGICTVCGACVSSCSLYHLKFINGKPKRPKRKAACENCEVCYQACYLTRSNLEAITESIFGRQKGERRVLSAKTREEKIRMACQDGGIVTSLLTYAFEQNFIDGALLVGKEDWMPFPIVAKSKEEFTLAAGTKFGIVPILGNLRPAIMNGLNKIGIVGTPCHVHSIRHIQYLKLEPLASVAKLIIGLFCRDNYEYQCIKEKIEEVGLRTREIKKFVVSEESFNIYTNKGKISIPITMAKSWRPKHCLICEDFTNELADISVGSDGSSQGWTTVIVRTERGEEIFSGLERSGIIDVEAIKDLNYVKEVSARKRNKAKQTKEIFRLKETGLDAGKIAIKLGVSEERVRHRLERF